MTDTVRRGSVDEEWVGFARSLVRDASPDAVGERVTRFAVDRLPAVDAASLTVPTTTRMVTAAPTGDLPVQVDSLQYRYGGPCVAAITGEATWQHVPDVSTETRWPRFTHAVLDDTPVRSILSCRLSDDAGEPIASLNLYATHRHAFDPDTTCLVRLFGAYAGLAWSCLRHQEAVRNLTTALDSNRRIATAIGILMSRHHCTQQQAFDLLRSSSQTTNRKLRDIAEDILPQTDRGGRPHPVG